MNVEEERQQQRYSSMLDPETLFNAKIEKFKAKHTFALQPLAKEPFQKALAVLADGGASVRVDGEGVRDFDSTQDHLLHPDGTSTQQ